MEVTCFQFATKKLFGKIRTFCLGLYICTEAISQFNCKVNFLCLRQRCKLSKKKIEFFHIKICLTYQKQQTLVFMGFDAIKIRV